MLRVPILRLGLLIFPEARSRTRPTRSKQTEDPIGDETSLGGCTEFGRVRCGTRVWGLRCGLRFVAGMGCGGSWGCAGVEVRGSRGLRCFAALSMTPVSGLPGAPGGDFAPGAFDFSSGPIPEAAR